MNLDVILYEGFEELCRGRISGDERIVTFAFGLNEEFFSRAIRYTNNEGKIYVDPANLLVAHFFNHLMQHRRQIRDMLIQTAVAPPVLDLHRVIKSIPDRLLAFLCG